MDPDLQKFLHNQFEEAQSSISGSEELPQLINGVTERYLEKAFLAEGGQKKIFTCKDSLTGRTIAYATLKDGADHEQTAKFMREARLTAHLEHPHIIPVYDTGLDENEIPYFTMKLISGQSFEEYLNEGHSLQSCIDALIKICEAVNFAHDNGVNHFDIKPENIQVSEYGEVLLCDWGLAGISYESCSEKVLDDEILKKVDLSQSLDRHFKGTAGYAAPEMWERKGERNHLCDIYSLGAVLYQILYQKTPPPKIDAGTFTVTGALQAVCCKAMQPKDKRYQSAAEFVRELKSWRQGFATEAENAGFATMLKLLILRHRNVSISILSSLILIIILSFVFIDSLKDREIAATKLANQLQQTEKQRLILEQELSPKYLLKAFDAFTRQELDAAMALADHVLRNEPGSVRAREIKGMILFVQQNFQEAAPFLTGNLKKLANKYKELVPLSVDNFVKVLIKLDRGKRDSELHVYKNLLITELEKDISVEQKRKIMLAEILYKNKKVKKVNFTLTKAAEGWIIDLSNNPKLTELWILEKLGPIYVKHLNLNNTPIGQLNQSLSLMQLEKISLRNWPAYNLSFLKGRRLLHLDVQDSKLDVRSTIVKSSLITLNIKGNHFNKWALLKDLKFLKELTVSKGALPDKIRAILEPKVKIIEL
jgi:serine/threonine protein kinase